MKIPMKKVTSLLFIPALVSLPAMAKQNTDWKSCSLSAMQLAQKVDERLHNLKTTSMVYEYHFKTPIGNGFQSGMCAVKSQSQYRVEYPLLGPSEKDLLFRKSIIRVGNKVTVLTSGRQSSRASFAAPFPYQAPANYVNTWFDKGVQDVLSAIGTNANPVEGLVKSAAADPEYKVAAEARDLWDIPKYKGIPVRTYRITVTRKPKYAARKGKLFYELVIGDVYFFPLSVTCQKSQGKTIYFTDMSRNRWNPNPQQKFRPNDFNPKIPHVIVDTSA
jgi:hypothetical protein